jgi:hypothetical protein
VAGATDRGVEVLLLTLDANHLARGAVGLAEVPVVEGQCGEAGLCESLRNGSNRRRVLRTAEAGAHHDARHRPAAPGVVDIADTGHAARVEAYLGSLNRRHSLLYRIGSCRHPAVGGCESRS